jgi:5-methylcytosine-specific restriction endonuclease McrA
MGRPRMPVSQLSKWGTWKRNQREKSSGPCMRCGNGKGDWHHKDHNPNNQSPKNLVRLCRSCHTARHNVEGR